MVVELLRHANLAAPSAYLKHKLKLMVNNLRGSFFIYLIYL